MTARVAVGSVGLANAARSIEKAKMTERSEKGRYPGNKLAVRKNKPVIKTSGTALAIAVMLKISLSRFFNFDHFNSPPTSKVMKARLMERRDSVFVIKSEEVKLSVFGLKRIPVKIYPMILGIPNVSHSLPMKYPMKTRNPSTSNVFIRFWAKLLRR